MLENPSSRLPVEILAEILSRAAGCVELRVHRRHFTSSESHSPWNLALVCKHWRDVILSTPSIWSNISLKVFPTKYTVHKYDALLSALKICLDRSGIHPLTIELVITSKPSNLIPVFVGPLMEHAQHWETITFRGPLDTLLPYLSNYPIQYTRLRRLCIDDKFHKSEKKWVGLFLDAPLLSHVSLISLPNHHQLLGGVGIPWSQISHLRIDVISGSLGDLIDLLQNTSNLLTLDYYILDADDAGVPSGLELSNLRRLSWIASNNDRYPHFRPSTSRFFQHLKAPRLSVLKVNGVCGDEEVDAIRGCLQRSNCAITSLDLSTPRLSSLLSLIPDIETLVFTNKPNPNIRYEDVTCGDFCDGPPYGFELAHLQKIKVGRSYHDDGPATSQFFESLEAPRLSVLELQGVCGDRELEAVRGFLRRSKCSVTLLSLSNPRLPSLFSLTPDVETLVLPSLGKRDLKSLLEKLTLDQSTIPCFLPKLKKIVVDFDIRSRSLCYAFIFMLESRLRAPLNSAAAPQCSVLKELELGNYFSMHIRHYISMELTSQEPLAITNTKSPRLYDRWDF